VGSGFDRSPDSELWQRACDHDGAAFEELFNRHAEAVYNHCFRRTASWSTAEELTSAVFLDAWRLRRSVRPYSDSLLPWLLAVANNSIRNSRRSLRRHRHRRLLAELPEPPHLIDFGDEADARLDDERAMSEVLKVLASLRIEEREVVALCDWAGLSYAEVAAALDLPPGTVRSRLFRAHQHLRDRLANEPGTPPLRSAQVPEERHERA